MPNYSSHKRILFPILATAMPVFILLAAFEVSLRAIGFRSPVIHAKMFEVEVNDLLLPYSLHPGYSGDYGGGSVSVNSNGNRVVPLPPEIEENRFSNEIVLLGDSVAFGQSLDDKDTIAANLQKYRLEGEKLARVALIAAPGYTSWNEYAALLRYTNLSRVRTVVLIYVSNDVTKDNDHFKFREFGARIYYMEKGWLRKLLQILYDHSRLFCLMSESIKKIVYLLQHEKVVASHEKAVSSGLDMDALAYSIEAIRRLNELCRARGINLIVAIYRDFYFDPDWVANYERSVSSSLSTAGVDHFILQSATERLGKSQFSVSWADGHPSVKASEIIAAEIAAELGRRGY
jgi:hypothetical protein